MDPLRAALDTDAPHDDAEAHAVAGIRALLDASIEASPVRRLLDGPPTKTS